jgi:hypothetical protein
MSKKTNPAESDALATPPAPSTPVPAPAPTPEPESAPPQTQAVTAASLVDADNDTFPASPPDTLPPSIAGVTQEDAKSEKRGGPRKGAGRPRKDKTDTPQTGEKSTGPVFGGDAPAPTKLPTDYNAIATMFFGLATNVLARAVGPEWLPRPGSPEQIRPGLPPVPAVPGEEQMVIPALAKYLEAQQMSDLPPGLMLVLVVSAYAAPRFREPATKEKIQGIWFWIRSKIGRKKMASVRSESARQNAEEMP